MEDARRKFMRQMTTAAVGTAVAPIGAFYSGTANAQAAQCKVNGQRTRGFGPLIKKLPENSADLGDIISGNLVNRPIIAVPRGFSYTILSGTGQQMDDGTAVPGLHDGMGAFQRKRGSRLRPRFGRDIHLVRNHEIDVGQNIFGQTEGVIANAGVKYDTQVAAGGTTTVVVDSRTKLVKRHYVSLAGTLRNCSGGRTPWNSWISSEEDIKAPIDNGGVVSVPHGYNFEVPAFSPRRAVEAIPLKAMGRFRHESVAVDPRTTAVYQTEDRSDSCFYAFVPTRKNRKYGDLQRGGKLFALVIPRNQRARCDNSRLPTVRANGKIVVDTRTGMKSFVGQPIKATWVEIEDPDPERDTVRREAQSKGAALFNRGEGMYWDPRRRLAYFCASKGGDAGTGQIWAYNPRRQTLTLMIESANRRMMDAPDNIVSGPDGTIYVCEDSSRRSYVFAFTRSGRTFRIVRNTYDRGELAGVCFSPDQKHMFVNLQGPGVTCCIYRDDGKKITLRNA